MHGYILYQEKISENARRLTILTQEDHIMVIRLARMSIQFRAYLRPFHLLNFQLSSNQSFLNQLETVNEPIPLMGNALAMGWYLNELLLFLVKPLEHIQGICHLYTHTLQTIQSGSDGLRIFEKQLLFSLGFAVDFMYDVSTRQAIQSGKYYRFYEKEGFKSCSVQEKGYSGETLWAMAHEVFNDKTRIEAKYLMRDILKPYLRGKVFKSRELWQK